MKNNRPFYIGIDVGGTNVRIGLVDENLHILFDEKHKSSEVAARFSEIIKAFVEKHQGDYNIVAISIGFPGLADQPTRNVYYVPNQRAFEGNYLARLEDELNIPIVIGNDTKYLMLYDAVYFKIPEDTSLLGFYLGTGFGNAIRIKDQLYLGDTGAAGEIGHVPVYLHGINPSVNKQDDLESLVSGLKLIEIHQKYFASTKFESLFIEHFDSKPIQDFLHVLSFYIVSEMIMLDITTIILGGGVIMSEQFPKEYLEKLIKKNLLTDLQRSRFKVYYAESSANSGVVGAAIYAKSYLKKNHK